MMPQSRVSSPILLLVFNRPDITREVFEAIRHARPTKLYIGADGPRKNISGELEKVNAVREYIMGNIDWSCEVQTRFRDTNLGCKRAVSDAISWFFSCESEGIILEDDCLPVPGFFTFCEWGLHEYRNRKAVGMISGSNLIDYLSPSPYRHGFSKYINVWGWATWRDRWNDCDLSISFSDIRRLDQQLIQDRALSTVERVFWKNVFKHTVMFPSTWDWYVQFQFFKYNLLSVFPSRNLVTNLGFGDSGTHTYGTPPLYWKKSLPDPKLDLMSLPVCDDFAVNRNRDRMLAATIWHCSPWRTVRLTLMNLARYLGT